MMAERLALAMLPGVGWSAREIQTIAREAEDAGFEAIFSTEVNNDALATAQLLGAATHRLKVGT
jgi:alkanesulfonate monooxygenase SsuD/methylene tetrahydromethanopterin reductase-like flavin-dependent oxidoreductase (luciferase family)